MKFSTIYGEKPLHQGVSCGEGLTIQSEKESCDINNIIRHYERTGEFYDPSAFPRVIPCKPIVGDFSNAPDFQEAQSIVLEGVKSFEALPSRIRKRFSNDPAEFLHWINDTNNLDAACEMGLFSPDYVSKLKLRLGLIEPPSPDPAPAPEPDPAAKV